MPKLVRSSRCSNYHASLTVPSSPLSQAPPLVLPLPQSQRENCADVSGNRSTGSIPFWSCDSPLTPPWNTIPHHHHHQQQRKVSEEDMYQNHRTQTSSCVHRNDIDTHDVSSSFSSSSDYDFETPKSLSSVSTASSSTSFTTNLKRRKPSVCLTDLVQSEQEENKKKSARATVSPTMTSLNHCNLQTNDQSPPPSQGVTSSHCETGGTSLSGWWGQFTTMTNEDSIFAHDLEDEGDEEEEERHFSQSDDNWDYNTMANATSFIPIQQRPNPTPNHHHHRQYYNSTYSSPCANHMQSYGGATTNISPSFSHSSTGSGNSRHNTKTSWRMALTATSLTPKSRNSDYDHHNHPYIYNKNTSTMKRQHIISLSTFSSQPHSSIDRFRHNKNHSTDSEQQRMQSSISSSSLFDEFILTCPSDRVYDDKHGNTDGSIDVATQRMSVLGL